MSIFDGRRYRKVIHKDPCSSKLQAFYGTVGSVIAQNGIELPLPKVMKLKLRNLDIYLLLEDAAIARFTRLNINS